MQMTAERMDTSHRARWTWLASLGLLLLGLGPLLMLAAGVIWGLELGEFGIILAITIIVPWVVAFLVWRFGTWAKVLGIVAALAVGFFLFWTAFGLTAPASFFDFVPGLLVIPGALIAVVSSIASIVAGRRGHVTGEPIGRERGAIRGVVAAIGILTVLSGVITLTSRSAVGAGEASLEVALRDFEFGQQRYDVEGGSRVVVRNRDPFLHTFTVDALGIDVELGPGSAASVDIPAQPGTYVVYCRPHTLNPENPGEDDMAASLAVS